MAKSGQGCQLDYIMSWLLRIKAEHFRYPYPRQATAIDNSVPVKNSLSLSPFHLRQQDLPPQPTYRPRPMSGSQQSCPRSLRCEARRSLKSRHRIERH